ncbi:MAG: pyruvate, phosphate dikinase [Candidatus Dojkabacteria bacterium]|nr:pyruvate, phosphate dikinase [Candidatus Dojkabacteria bacterium]
MQKSTTKTSSPTVSPSKQETTPSPSIYAFSQSVSQMPQSETPKYILGGKGLGLAEMSKIKLPVPPVIVVSIPTCTYFQEHDGTYPDGFEKELNDGIAFLEKETGKGFGDPQSPLLVSVRSGAAISMPGMMDTVLNLGLNPSTLEGLSKKTGNPRFAWDCYRRFLQMFGDVVLGIEHHSFEGLLDEVKRKNGVSNDTELSVEMLKTVVEKYRALIQNETGSAFPDDPMEQLNMAIGAVFKSWNNPRAVSYRRINRVPPEINGTAVNVQAMVFGNLGDTSATGVAFTRNPSTGDKEFYGEYLMNAQGEDVVAGIRTPKHLSEMNTDLPEVYEELTAIFGQLEEHFKDMIDLEFTIEEEKLYILQARSGKRTGKAAVKIAVDMEQEGLIDRKKALLSIDPSALDQLLHPMIDPKAEKQVIAKGLPASPGAVSGQIVFSAIDAVEWAGQGKKTILVRNETSPEDIEGMNSALGFLTARGGMTSHAAVVARGMGKSCVSGSSDIAVNEEKKLLHCGADIDLKEGDWITLDGSVGEVYLGKVSTVEPEMSGDFATIMQWADEVRELRVRTNADTPKDAATARKFGAEGIGLCRTEHMFFKEDRIFAMREMILSETLEERVKALSTIEKMQQSDFEELFTEMDGFPVTIRLLDPPLHEFLPHEDAEIEEIAREMKVDAEVLKARREALSEVNPMLGFRGCRLAVVYPEITEMQVRAILNAAAVVAKKGVDVRPEIEIPVTSHYREVEILTEVIKRVADEVGGKENSESGHTDKNNKKSPAVTFKVGTMIELPRACVTADEFARTMEFFSFGTNDLTQTTFGYSRDDAGRFITKYIELGVYQVDPFQSIDEKGVGEMMLIAVEKGRAVRKDLEIGICGEHGGDPKSVEFCHRLGLDYVSCSPYRVPIARLAAAQAAVRE